MRFLGRFVLVIAFTLYAAALWAQMASPNIVKISATLSADKLAAGSKFRLAVVAKVQKGKHVNAEGSETAIPPTLTIASVQGVSFGKPQFPPPAKKKFAFSDRPLPVYEGSFKIIVPGEVARTAKPGTRALKISLGYQACDDSTCYPPGKASTQLIAKVTSAGNAKSASTGASCETANSPTPAAAGLTGRLLNALKGSNPIVAALISFLLGIGLCLTPCVYPMIPVTLGFFAGQAHGHRKRSLGLALAYVLGIAITYSIIGFAAASFGMMVGSLLRNPIVISVIVVVFLALAASMFGLFKLRPPAFIVNRTGGRSGLAGALLMGLMLGIVASPCIGPPVAGVALWVTQIKQPVLGFWIFLSLALGMGTPFLALGMCAGGVCRTPRAGPWMITVNKLSGLALMGAGLYFGRLLLPEPVQRYIMPAFLFGSAAYLSLSRSALQLGRASVFARPLFAVALIALALTPLLAGKPVSQIKWSPYTAQSLEQAREDGRPVMIDFSAAWCQVCKDLEKHTFSDPKVVQASCSFVALRADMTRQTALSDSLAKRFNVQGLPTIVFIDSHGKEMQNLRVVGDISPKDFLGRMAAVR
jgi:thioredoxin:protein disulfide reductase